jgi:predicted N-formylglutamate amidohydrolase
VLLDCVGRLPVLFVCDHASNIIPGALAGLGLGSAELDKHIAWDIGAGNVAVALAAHFHVPVVLAATSRLVVDCNRNLDDPTAFPIISDGAAVPGNVGLDEAARQARADTYYWPYHHAIRDKLRELESLAAAPALIAVHSFTPTMDGEGRPWHIGALWDKDPRIAVPLINALRSRGGLVVGDNEPYSGRHPADFTLDHHAEAEGLPHLGIEIRQDLIDTPAGVAEYAQILADRLGPILEDRQLYTHRAGLMQ